MTDQHDTAPQLDPFTAGIQLQVAVEQLTQPGTVNLDRDIPLPGTDAWQLMADDRDLEADLRHRIDTAPDREQRGAAVRNLLLLQHRRAARTAPASTLPPLLEQLHDAVHSSTSTGGGPAKAAAHRSPIGLDAAALLADVQRTTGAGNTTPAVLIRAVREWAGQLTADDPEPLVTAAEKAQRWADTGYELLNPSRRLDLVNACPACGKRRADTEKDGEIVQRAALELNLTTKTVRCLCCRELWREHQLDLLRRVLDQQLTEPRR